MLIGIDASRAFVSDKTGTENYSYHLITHLLRLPESKIHHFVLFVRPNAVLPHKILDYANVRVVRIKFRYLWTQVGLAWATWKSVEVKGERSKLDVLWIPAHTLPVLRKPGIKTVVTIHGLEYKFLKEYNNLLQRWYLPLSTYYAAWSADRLIAVSEATKRDLLAEISFDPEKISVIYEGVQAEERIVNSEYREKVYTKFSIQDSKFILFVGTVQPRKNIISLIAAYARLHQAYPGLSAGKAGYKLVIAGGIGWDAEEVLQESVKLGIPDKVIFTGRVDDLVLQSLYLGASLYVQPSITEGFGLPVLEAMHYGVPTIVSDGGALSEVVGEAGIVVPLKPQFVKNLASAMKRVLSDPKLQKNMITRGYKNARDYSWEACAKATFPVLVG